MASFSVFAQTIDDATNRVHPALEAEPDSVRRVALQSRQPPYSQLLRDLWLLTAEQLGTQSELYILPADAFNRALLTAPHADGESDGHEAPAIDWFVGLRAEQAEAAGLYLGPQILTHDITLFQRRHLPVMNSVEDASGFVVGVVEASYIYEWLRAEHPELTLRTYPDLKTLVDAALAGRIHVFAGPALLGSQLSAAHNSPQTASGHGANASPLTELGRAFPADRRLSLFSVPLFLAARNATDIGELERAFGALSDAQQRYLQTQANRDMTSLVSLQQDELEWLLARDSVLVGVPSDSRPILFFDRQGEAVGLDADFLSLLSQRSSINFSFIGCGNWDACLRALAQRDIDVLSFVSDTPARREFAAFTSVYWETPWAIASTEAGLFNADQLSAMQNKRIAITRSYSVFEQAMQMPGIEVHPVSSPEEGMIAVIEGRVDGYLDSLPLLVERVREQHTGNLYLNILHGQQGDAVTFAVRKDWPVLRDILDRAVQTISDADQQQIAERWFDVNYEQGVSFTDVRRWMFYTALAVAALIAFFLWRNSKLRQEVKRRKSAEKKMRHLARHDDLTGLPNRHLLDDRMKQIVASHQRYKRQFAVLFLDLDGFKEVNDEQGHDVGDALLKQVATRLNESVRAQDTVCRFGGDEFIVVLTEQHNATQA
ncbi:MAG: transporter substrate-binding domain-containing protein, partial [Idiomarina sp.]|nr:transporter substrate-binding domain-containing protein [Idiomarina sp.]